MILIKAFLTVMALVTFLWVWKHESGRRLMVTPFVFAMYYEFMRVLPPFVMSGTYANIESIQPFLAAFIAFMSVTVGFIWFYFSRYAGPHRAASLLASRTRPLTISRFQHVGVLGVAVVLVISGLVFYRGVPPALVAVVGIVSGGGEGLAALVSEQRFALTKGAYFGASYRGQGIFTALQLTGWSLVVGYATLVWSDRRTRRSLAILAAAAFGAWVFVAGTGARGPFLNVLLFAIAVYSLRSPLTVKTVVPIVAGLVALAVGLSLYSGKMYYLATNEPDFMGEAIRRIVERIFMGNGINDVYVLDLVNDGAFNLRWGQNHWREFLSALPGIDAPPPLSYELFVFMNPSSDATTFSSGTYLSSVFIDFGWWGLIPVFLLVGAVIAYFQRRLFAVEPSPWKICVAAFIGISMANILKSGFIGIAAQLVLFFILVGLQATIYHVARQLGRRRSWAAK